MNRIIQLDDHWNDIWPRMLFDDLSFWCKCGKIVAMRHIIDVWHTIIIITNGNVISTENKPSSCWRWWQICAALISVDFYGLDRYIRQIKNYAMRFCMVVSQFLAFAIVPRHLIFMRFQCSTVCIFQTIKMVDSVSFLPHGIFAHLHNINNINFVVNIFEAQNYFY